MMSSLSRYDPIKGCFVLKDLNPKPPANAFEWKRYTQEESIRRGDKIVSHDTALKKSMASTKAIERKRQTDPSYGTVGNMERTAEMIAMKPKTFTIYSRAQLDKGTKK